MKTSIKSIIFAVALGSLFATTNIAFANDHDSVSNILLAKGTENKFADFMNQKAKRFVKNQEDWNIFEQVVTLYNVSPSKFLMVDSETKNSFNEATKAIDKKLGQMNNEEAKMWRNKVQATANVINILWNKNFNAEPIEAERTQNSVVMLGK